MMFWGRPPGDISPNLEQQNPDQDQNLAPAMLPGTPDREFQPNNMIENVNAVQENHEEVELDQLQPLKGMMDGEDEDMPQIDNQHLLNQQPLNQQDRQHQMDWLDRLLLTHCLLLLLNHQVGLGPCIQGCPRHWINHCIGFDGGGGGGGGGSRDGTNSWRCSKAWWIRFA